MNKSFQYRETEVNPFFVEYYDETGQGWSEWKDCDVWIAMSKDEYPEFYQVRTIIQGFVND